MILGIDEVGRGPWAGPLVVGAVVLGAAEIDGLTDSKKLSKARRETYAVQIRESATAYGLGWVAADEIDAIGLSEALKLATIRAVEQITTSYHEIIIDGTINFLEGTTKGEYVTTLKKADALIPSVSAASIIAKVARDAYMAEQSKIYPEYGFDSHVGYGTAAHREAIAKYGVTPLHRLSFAPLKEYQTSSTVTTKSLGDKAEDKVAMYLRKLGHRIVERNWKTKFCEIDIVSSVGDKLYFTEVKYRHSAVFGGGVAAITTKKLTKMKFAAEYYAVKHGRFSADMQLAFSTVQGDDFTVEGWQVID